MEQRNITLRGHAGQPDSTRVMHSRENGKAEGLLSVKRLQNQPEGAQWACLRRPYGSIAGLLFQQY